MPDAEDFQLPSFPFPRSGDARSILEGRLAGLGSIAPSLPVYVDVGSRKIESQIERDGIPINVLHVDPNLLKEELFERPLLSVRVVSQSVAPGTPVPVGTSVDLVMTRPGTLPGRIFTGMHSALREDNIAAAYGRLIGQQNFPIVKRILNHAAEGRLSAQDTDEVRRMFEAADAPVIDDQADANLDTAVTTLAILTTFGA